MLQLVNKTPLVAQLFLFPNEEGIDCAYAVIKATFRMTPAVTLSEEQLPVILTDQFWGEPGKSSLKCASEATLIKPGTDIVMQGSAHAPDGRPATQVDVTLAVGALKKTVRVIGDREWKKGLVSTSRSSPQPFVRLPLVYERSFGGTDRSREKDGILESEPRNPVGIGFLGKKTAQSVDGMKLPNLEDPKDLVSNPGSRPAPVGFGPVAASWEPRRSFAGTYNEAWQKSRCPYLPTDFNPRFFNMASPDLVATPYLQGGEAVVLENVRVEGVVRFTLPRLGPKATLVIEDARHEPAMNLDTVTFEPDQNRFSMVWRGMVPCDKKTLKIKAMHVSCPEVEAG